MAKKSCFEWKLDRNGCKVKEVETPIDPTAKKMRRGRKVHVYTPDEKRKFSAMDSFDRHQLALNSFDEGKSDPVAVALGQSARQQEELEAAKKREDALWAMYAMCGGYMSKPQRERYHKLLKDLIKRDDDERVMFCPKKMWLEKGQKLKERVLGTSTDRPVRSKKNRSAR